MDNLVVERSTLTGRWGAVFLIVAVVLAAAAPFLFVDSVVRTLIQFFYLLALAQMWNLLAGYAGLVSIGQQAYIGIGAYALLAFADKFNVNIFLAVVLAGLAAAILSLPTAALVFRLRGGYFAVGTWVVAEVYRLLASNSQWLGGGSGATITSAIHIDHTLRTNVTYWVALALGIGSVLLVFYLLRTKLGLGLRAVRDNENAARTLGVDVFRTKVKVYVLASTVCGLTGAIIYLDLLRVQPNATFSVNWTAFMIFAVVIGGTGTITGPIVGTVLYLMLQHYLSAYGEVYLIILGALAILVMLKMPKGLWGYVMEHSNVQFFPVRLRVSKQPSEHD